MLCAKMADVKWDEYDEILPTIGSCAPLIDEAP